MLSWIEGRYASYILLAYGLSFASLIVLFWAVRSHFCQIRNSMRAVNKEY
ncbi:MAG: hypothetical protein CMF48_03025 [Legionellales bacterium]|nr:hypothetical protein [Legionellales bacterium]